MNSARPTGSMPLSGSSRTSNSGSWIKRLRHLDALAHALGVAAHDRGRAVAHADQFQRRLGAPPRLAAA